MIAALIIYECKAHKLYVTVIYVLMIYGKWNPQEPDYSNWYFNNSKGWNIHESKTHNERYNSL